MASGPGSREAQPSEGHQPRTSGHILVSTRSPAIGYAALAYSRLMRLEVAFRARSIRIDTEAVEGPSRPWKSWLGSDQKGGCNAKVAPHSIPRACQPRRHGGQ